MKVVLYQKNKFGNWYVADFVSDIEYNVSKYIENATIFDTKEQKDEIGKMQYRHDLTKKKVEVK